MRSRSGSSSNETSSSTARSQFDDPTYIFPTTVTLVSRSSNVVVGVFVAVGGPSEESSHGSVR